ncbi:hypothetical protein Hamer_G027979 [Homarus americanus]|uniref:Uncharacterized protein n=1 Tax=Homarus americanus TaxID=6706 RepID=A0A8J5K448_HOMAM|nr:hypothetical protein Hamer_G027979 [Homarus americanus]
MITVVVNKLQLMCEFRELAKAMEASIHRPGTPKARRGSEKIKFRDFPSGSEPDERKTAGEAEEASCYHGY